MELVDTALWKVTFEISEDDDVCEVKAHMDAGDRSLSGFGRARRNPNDPAVPQIGEELATARSLQDLAHHLLDDVTRMIEDFEPGADPITA